MLRSVKDLERCAVGATDGDIGHVEDIYFDDQSWVVRYLVVEAGAWLSSRRVLISPTAMGSSLWDHGLLHIALTKEQVRQSPDSDTHKPVFLQSTPPGGDAHDDPHLRSYRRVMTYRIRATDGDIGHVTGMLVDDQTWAICYLVVDTSNWWLGHQLLVAPQWIDHVNAPESRVSIKLTRQTVRDAPAYDPEGRLECIEEAMLEGYFVRPHSAPMAGRPVVAPHPHHQRT